MRLALALITVTFALVACGPARDEGAGVVKVDDPGIIVFSGFSGDGGHLYGIRPDGTGQRPFDLRESCATPLDFSSDAQVIACADSFPPANEGIYVMQRDGSDWHQVPLDAGDNLAPALSPDGSQIVYVRSSLDRDTSQELWKARTDGKEQERLMPGDNDAPDWSPDGETIAFIRNPDWSACTHGEGDVVVMGAKGGEYRLVAKEGGVPAWSPDGRRLAFMKDCNSIWISSIRGGSQTLLVGDAYLDSLAWSPNGKRMAFLRQTTCGHAACAVRVFIVPTVGGGDPKPIGPTLSENTVAIFWLPSSVASMRPGQR